MQARLERLELSRCPPTFPDGVALARAAGYEPDDWQRGVLLSTSRRLLLNCSRQSGKSTVVATLALWTALRRRRSLVLLLSPGERQSGEIYRKALDVYRAVDRPVPALTENKLELELANGSRIVALPGQEGTIRGYSGAALLVIDEASRVADDLYRGVRPMLSVSRGCLALLSTPWGKRGFFYEEWQRRDQWEYYEVRADRCPRHDPAFLAEERRTLSPFWYRQEYECQFSESGEQLISYEDAMASISDGVRPLFAADPGPLHVAS
jgi:hypothetical protein